MSEEKLIATRESFGKALAELKDENIVVLDADLSTSTKTNLFQEKYPNRLWFRNNIILVRTRNELEYNIQWVEETKSRS